MKKYNRKSKRVLSIQEVSTCNGTSVYCNIVCFGNEVAILSSSRKAKLLWRSRRGMLELDLVLNAFIDRYFDDLNPEQLDSFEKLLAHDDPEIFDWLMSDSTIEDTVLHALIERLRAIRIMLKHPSKN